MLHHVPVLFIEIPEPVVRDGHAGYVAGRYRDGAFSDVWTDVRRCADRTFVAYAPACSCGWTGATVPVSDVAYHQCRRAWLRDHIRELAPLARAQP